MAAAAVTNDTVMFAFFAGLAAGLLHVFSGPDHLAAVAPLVVDADRVHPARSEKSKPIRVEGWRTGLQWGVGHTAGVLVIAALLLWLRERLPLDLISAYSERIIGVALIAVGGWGIWKASRARITPHSHAGASFAMGTVHGLAGSSHLFGVLPALAFVDRAESIFYLGGFAIGAIAGMSAFAAGMGLLALRLGGNQQRRFRGLLYASSAAALVIGGFWLVGR
ncbi:MAG: High-affinity nickel transporter [Vicinamibacterales bacterium]